MARLPTRDDLSGIASLRSGRPIASVDVSGLARGIQQAGDDLTALGNERRKQEDAVGIAKAEAELNQGLIRVKSEFDQDPNYSTFRERAPKATGDLVKTAAQYIRDPNLRERWLQGASTEAARTNASIDAKAEALGRQATQVNVDQTLEAQRRIYVDPNTTDEEKAKALSDINGTIEVSTQTGIFTPEQADQRKQLFIRDANFSRAKLFAQQNPKSVIDWSRAARGDIGKLVMEKATQHGVDPAILLGIGQIESGLNPKAKAPTSSASGIFQFIDETGKRYGIDNPFDAEQNADAGARLTRDNINGLRRSIGREPTPGEIYLAHFSGLGAAQKLGRASDDTPASEIFSDAAIRANPSILAGKTAGEVKAWADRKMADAMQRAAGAPPSAGPTRDNAAAIAVAAPKWFDDLSPEERAAAYDIAETTQRQQLAARAADIKAIQTSARDTYSLRIATGDPTLTPQEILSDQRIDNGDKAALINTYNTARKEAVTGAAALAAFANGTLSVDPYSTEGKKAVDFIGKEIDKSVPEDRRQAITESLVKTTGLVPQNTFNAIRAGLDSTNVAEVTAAAQMAARISQISPAALGRRDGGATVQSTADDFGFYVNTLNMTPEQAAQKIMDARNPAKQLERKALAPAAKEFVKQIENENIGAMFDDSWLPFNDPKVGFNEAQALGIQAEYKAIAEEQFYQANGNPELAKNRAREEMKRLYGVTEIGGSRTVMKFPPEKYWPAMPEASDPYGYAKDQLIADLAKAFPDDATLNPKKTDGGYVGMVDGRAVDIRDERGLAQFRDMARDSILSRITLVATPETGMEIKANQLPGYTVLFRDDNGNYQTLYGKQWRPDLTDVVNESRQQQQDRLNRAATFQQMGRGLADYLSGGQIPMGAGSAWDNPEAQQIVPGEAQ